MTSDSTPPSPAAEEDIRRPRRAVTLQTRLMATVIAVVAVILVIVAVTVSTILGSVLQSNLQSQLVAASRTLQVIDRTLGVIPTVRDAADTLASSPGVPVGFLLVLDDGTTTSGAVMGDDGTVTELTTTQIAQLTESVARDDPNVTLTGLGAYRIGTVHTPGTNLVGVSGLPMTEVTSTIAKMLMTVALVTAAGLVLLALAIAFVIRLGLKPLRAVADTATRVASLPLDQGAVSIADRVPPAEADERTEIGRVGAALNILLDHVDTSLDARQRNEERMRRFVADASHELRTPLASIRGYSELSLRALRQTPGHGSAEDTESSLERIQAQSVRMTRLVEDLLLLARLDEGQEIVYGSVDLTRLVIEAVGDARPAGPAHTWQLDIGDEPLVIAGDAGRLHQVIANLLANARTHTPAGTTVRVTLVRDGSDAVLSVHDDGPGIEPSLTAELFERFARGDRSRARKTGGTGLGLSIAKAIVEAHSGTISVVSEPGDTTFTVRLPARPADPVDDGVETEPELDADGIPLADDPGQ